MSGISRRLLVLNPDFPGLYPGGGNRAKCGKVPFLLIF
jgi:hypothetical protein